MQNEKSFTVQIRFSSLFSQTAVFFLDERHDGTKRLPHTDTMIML